MAASAPGKLILFGEHAVVFGEPALATAIILRAEVYARTTPEWRVEGGSIDEPGYRYVKAAIAKVKTSGPLWLEVRSMVPSGAGLGSSAAVTVATLRSLHGMGGSLDAKTIAREAFEVEHEVQGRASPIDTSTASAGGCLLVLPKPQGDLLWTIERDARRWCLHRTDLPPLDFVIGNTGISAATGPLVANVKERVEHDRKAADAVREIGRITLDGMEALRRNDLAAAGRLMDRNHALLSVHAAELITLQGPAGPRRREMAEDLGLVEDGGVYAEGERIVEVGPTADVLGRHPQASVKIDATGQTVLPGFVDAHTHAVFAGSREHEVEWKAQGLGYRDIAARGGGILHTMRATREAREEDLARAPTERFRRRLAFGTTTIEVKSGYGLRTEDELKILRAAAKSGQAAGVDVVRTFLGAHAIPPEFEGRADAYVEVVAGDMIDAVVSSRLASFCDVFVDDGFFTADQGRRILTRAKSAGLGGKVPSDEPADTGGAGLGAEIDGASADHLLHASSAGIDALARTSTVGVLLPATSLVSHLPFADGRRLIAAGVPVALGTDFNPNTWCESTQLTIALACHHNGLLPAQAVVAATINAAHAVGLGTEVGSLEPGKLADILVLGVPSYRHLGYRIGGNAGRVVRKRGGGQGGGPIQ